jgi:hypothetical protein
MAILPSREYLLECFDYDKDTDTLTWRKRPAEHFESANAYRAHLKQTCGRQIRSNANVVSINKKTFTKSRIIFKIVNGFEPPSRINQRGCIDKNKDYYRASICIDNKRFTKFFKSEYLAKDFIKEMRVKFEKNEIPIVKNKKVSNTGFHGVAADKKKFSATIKFKMKAYYLGVYETAKEASDVYQLAKQQIKDGLFVHPNFKVENKTGFKGVIKTKSGSFESYYKRKYLGTFKTPEEAHDAYLKAKNHKTFDDGLDILQKLAQQYG